MTDPRSADTIRDSFLLTLRGEHEAIGERVVTAPRTPYYILGTALALECEGAEFQAESARAEAFPDTASEAGVLKHAEFSGITRGAAARAVVRAMVTGTPSTSGVIAAGKTATGATGLVYLVDDASWALDGTGEGHVSLTARDAGADGNVELGHEFTWQNGAPLGLAATLVADPDVGDASHLLVVGADDESIEDLRARCEVFRKEPKQGGTRADWVNNALAVEGVGSAFIWPRSWLFGGVWSVNVPGTLVVQVLSAAPAATTYVQNPDGTLGLGLDPSFTRNPTALLLDRVRGYIEGTNDAQGVALPEALQAPLRPAGMAAGNYRVLGPVTSTPVDVTVAVIVDPAIAPWPWGVTAGPPAYRTITARTSTTVTLDNVFEITDGSRLAVFLGTSVVRGGWWLATVSGAPVGLVVTLSQAMPALPAVSALVRPDCGLWGAIRTAVLGYVDDLGPGDDTSIASQRFPRPNDSSPDRFFNSRVVDLVQDIVGVSSVVVSAPASPVTTPTVGTRLVPGEIRVVIG